MKADFDSAKAAKDIVELVCGKDTKSTVDYNKDSDRFTVCCPVNFGGLEVELKVEVKKSELNELSSLAIALLPSHKWEDSYEVEDEGLTGKPHRFEKSCRLNVGTCRESTLEISYHNGSYSIGGSHSYPYLRRNPEILLEHIQQDYDRLLQFVLKTLQRADK